MSADFPPISQIGEPFWEIATLFPVQGEWSEQDYLNLDTNRMIEFNEGKLEVLPMTTELHQFIAYYLCTVLRGLNAGNPPGAAVLAPFRMRLFTGKFREPDLMFMLHENRDRRNNKFWEGADLAIEIVSEDDPNRDLVIKRAEYAQAKISEYWIVDPRDHSIRVLTLDAGATEYRESGFYTGEDIAQSDLLEDFRVSANQVFDQQQ